MGQCHSGSRSRLSVPSGKSEQKSVQPNRDFVTALRDACFGEEDGVGFAALAPQDQLAAEPASYAQELFYKRLGLKAMASLAHFAKHPKLKNGCLAPSDAASLIFGNDESIEPLKKRISRLFEVAISPDTELTAWQFLSIQSMMESELWQFFSFFADFDEDLKLSSEDMIQTVTVLIDFAISMCGNDVPEALAAFKNLPLEDQERGVVQWAAQFSAPKDRRECRQWFETVVYSALSRHRTVTLDGLQDAIQRTLPHERLAQMERGNDMPELLAR